MHQTARQVRFSLLNRTNNHVDDLGIVKVAALSTVDVQNMAKRRFVAVGLPDKGTVVCLSLKSFLLGRILVSFRPISPLQLQRRRTGLQISLVCS